MLQEITYHIFTKLSTLIKNLKEFREIPKWAFFGLIYAHYKSIDKPRDYASLISDIESFLNNFHSIKFFHPNFEKT